MTIATVFLTYPESEKESIRRSMKSSLTQMEIQKNMFQHVSFSMAVGAAYKEAEHLADSMQEAPKTDPGKAGKRGRTGS